MKSIKISESRLKKIIGESLNKIMQESFGDYISDKLKKKRDNPEQAEKDLERGNFNLDTNRFAVEENEDFSEFGLEPDPEEKKKEINQAWDEYNTMDAKINKVTPEKITSLKPNEIFVFGSNLKGLHAGGAARFALDRFGAEWGNGVGIQGNSYAIPTLSNPGGMTAHMLPIPVIGKYVNQFLAYAAKHPSLIFYVTPIGCGIAGFTPEEIAPLFRQALEMNNVTLPQDFLNVLNDDGWR